MESNIISKEAKVVRVADNTVFANEFIKKRLDSWQTHLKNIAHYLVASENVWWHKHEESYQFFDGDGQPHFRPEGPHLKHFRITNYADVKSVQSEAWTTILPLCLLHVSSCLTQTVSLLHGSHLHQIPQTKSTNKGRNLSLG